MRNARAVVIAAALVAGTPVLAATGWSLKIDEGAVGAAYVGVPPRVETFTLMVTEEYPGGAVLHAEFFDLVVGPAPLPTSPLKKVLVAEEIDGNRVTNRIFLRKHFSGLGGIELPPIPAGYEIQIIPKLFRVTRKDGISGFRARLEAGPIVTGTWDVSVTVTGGTAAAVGEVGTAVATLDQAAGIVSGTFLFDDGDSGNVTGIISGQTFSFDVEQTDPLCPGSFSGLATVLGSNRQMAGRYSGSSCGGTLEADLDATRR